MHVNFHFMIAMNIQMIWELWNSFILWLTARMRSVHAAFFPLRVYCWNFNNTFVAVAIKKTETFCSKCIVVIEEKAFGLEYSVFTSAIVRTKEFLENKYFLAIH